MLIYLLIFVLILYHSFLKYIFHCKKKKYKKEQKYLYGHIICLDIFIVTIVLTLSLNYLFFSSMDTKNIQRFNGEIKDLQTTSQNSEIKKLKASVDYLVYKHLIEEKDISYYYVMGYSDRLNNDVLKYFNGMSYEDILKQAKKEAIIDNVKSFNTANLNSFIYSYYSMSVVSDYNYSLDIAFKLLKIKIIKYNDIKQSITPEVFINRITNIAIKNMSVFEGKNIDFLGTISNDFSNIIFEDVNK